MRLRTGPGHAVVLGETQSPTETSETKVGGVHVSAQRTKVEQCDSVPGGKWRARGSSRWPQVAAGGRGVTRGQIP
jgi:hypothetical protein